MILRCESCMGEVLCLDEESRTALIGATLIARAKGQGFEGKCWGCGHATFFPRDLRFYGYLLGAATEMPKGGCLFYYGIELFVGGEGLTGSIEDTSLIVDLCDIDATPADTSPRPPGMIGVHFDEGGATRVGSRPMKREEGEA